MLPPPYSSVSRPHRGAASGRHQGGGGIAGPTSVSWSVASAERIVARSSNYLRTLVALDDDPQPLRILEGIGELGDQLGAV